MILIFITWQHFYSRKQDIEKSSYISPEELKTFYDCPTFKEYHDYDE